MEMLGSTSSYIQIQRTSLYVISTHFCITKSVNQPGENRTVRKTNLRISLFSRFKPKETKYYFHWGVFINYVFQY